MTHIFGKAPERICRGCGCTDSDACITADGPCSWVLLDVDTPTGICSTCAVDMAFDPQIMATTCLPEVLEALRRIGATA